ncbi:MAG: DUF853 domain-containing protein [Bacteroidia bacterium]|jgi:hypothetical protein|nr:DUF853 domain-containing protein [Bacteroidia bacterium]
MSTSTPFVNTIVSGYSPKGKYITLGAALFEDQPVKDAQVKIPIKTFNRHGLIAGATGTGKTITLQIIAESLCAEGVPVLLMDLKGDLSGISEKGSANAKIEERHAAIGMPYHPEGSSAEFFSISDEPGVRLKATVSEFGPVLFSKILELNDTQSGIMAMLFKYADEHELPLLDLKDIKQLLQYAGNEGKADIQKEYGGISSSSIATITRKIIELEGQGADVFFGEPSFEVKDLLRLDEKGKGIASIIRLSDIQDKPKLFSSFMLCLLAEVYASFPESGDLEQPKLCIFIEEAHLIFKEASKALLNQIESIIKLIRSKGVGVFFITQNPYDIPDVVLSQLGLKVQHALRAFTEKDRKAIRKTAENYPNSEFYKTDELLTNLGIGQALITALNEKGIPTPLAAVHLKAPASRIGTLSNEEIELKLKSSELIHKYNKTIDRDSAYEILREKIQEVSKAPLPSEKETRKTKEEKTLLDKAGANPLVKQIGRTVAREVTRGLLGVLGIGTRRKKSWF